MSEWDVEEPQEPPRSAQPDPEPPSVPELPEDHVPTVDEEQFVTMLDGLEDAPRVKVDAEEEEPLLPSVNPKVGPETQSQRDARYRAIREKEEKNLAAVIGSDSAWAQFQQVELERSKKLEPLRKAYLDAQRKKAK